MRCPRVSGLTRAVPSITPPDRTQRGAYSRRMPNQDVVFAGSVPDNYDEYFVPIIFEPYAALLADHFAKAAPKPRALLEIAAGTGAVTRRLATVLAESTRIVATDLNPAMIERARKTGT